MTEAETVALLCDLLERREPFVHCRFGDGDVFFATGTGPKITGDGEEWSRHLQRQLLGAWQELFWSDTHLLIGDVSTYAEDDGCSKEWFTLLEMSSWLQGSDTTLVHIEALRAGFGYSVPFYRALADDKRRKLYVAPEGLRLAADMLGAEHLAVPLQRAHIAAATVFPEILRAEPEIVLFSAGRGGKLLQAWLANVEPSITQVDIGSGLDLLFTDLRRSTDLGVDVETVRASFREAGLRVD